MKSIILLLFIILPCIKLYGQPQGNEFYTNFNFKVLTEQKDTILFTIFNDKKSLFSKNKNYEIAFFLVGLNENKQKIDSKNITERVSLNNNKSLKIGYVSYLDLGRYPDNKIPNYWDIVVVLRKGKKLMRTTYKIYKQVSLYEINMKSPINTIINFKVGNFEVTNPEN